MEDYTITTIYFDGQFWTALIEKKIGDSFYTGRYVFGSEPSNPEILHWMIYGFDKVKFFPIEKPIKIRVKKESDKTHSIKKSLDAFKESQKSFFEEKKSLSKIEKREEKQQKFLLQQQKKKEKRKH